MSINSLRRTLTALSVGGLLAAGTLTAPPATATPIGYIAALNAGGISVNDTVAALTAGYRICDDLNTHTGDVVVPRIYNTFYDVTSYEQAATMLVAAVANLCPWHDHRGSAA